MSGRAPIVALGAALALSLGLHVRLLLKHEPPPPPCPACPPAPPSLPPSEVETKLQRCEQRRWELVLETIAADHAKGPPRGKAEPKVDLGTGPAAQADALCEKAKASLREGWERDRENIIRGVARSLGDRAEQERNAASELASMRRATGMSDREAAELEGPYRKLREARLEAIRAGLEREPPALDAVLADVRGLYADEDALLRRVLGEAPAQAWRADQLGSRTVILAIAATLAGQDWDDSIRW